MNCECIDNTPVLEELTEFLDVYNKEGKKVDKIPDVNPIRYKTTLECVSSLNKLKLELPLTNRESKLIDKCIEALHTPDETIVDFGYWDINLLQKLSKKYQQSDEILACAHFLRENFQPCGTLSAEDAEKLINIVHKINSVMSKPLYRAFGSNDKNNTELALDNTESSSDETESSSGNS
jgi:hypothetical protein